MIQIRCAWCGKDMGTKDGELDTISHGICGKCQSQVLAEWHGVAGRQKGGEGLDTPPVPGTAREEDSPPSRGIRLADCGPLTGAIAR